MLLHLQDCKARRREDRVVMIDAGAREPEVAHEMRYDFDHEVKLHGPDVPDVKID